MSGIRLSKTTCNPREPTFHSHNIQRIRVEGGLGGQNLQPVRLNPVTAQHCRRSAIAEKRTGDQVAFRVVARDKGQAAKLDAHQEHAVFRVAERVVVGVRESRRPARTTQSPHRSPPDVPAQTQDVDKPRINRRCSQTRRVDEDDIVDLPGLQAASVEHPTSGFGAQVCGRLYEYPIRLLGLVFQAKPFEGPRKIAGANPRMVKDRKEPINLRNLRDEQLARIFANTSLLHAVGRHRRPDAIQFRHTLILAAAEAHV